MRDPWEGVSPRGTIVTGARRERVPATFEPLLAMATALVRSNSAQGSLYLYGSVATGQARVPASDLDLFTVDVDPEAATAIGQTLSRRFGGVCRSVDIGTATTSDYLADTDQAYGNRVFLRHYSVHLAGPPRHEGLPDYPADVRAARGFNGDIALHADRWRVEFEAGADTAAVARRVARKSLFAVAGLVSVHDAGWTTDRVRSARRWAEIEPALAADLMAMVEWSEGRNCPDRGKLATTLDGPVDRLVSAFASRIGLWGGGPARQSPPATPTN